MGSADAEEPLQVGTGPLALQAPPGHLAVAGPWAVTHVRRACPALPPYRPGAAEPSSLIWGSQEAGESEAGPGGGGGLTTSWFPSGRPRHRLGGPGELSRGLISVQPRGGAPTRGRQAEPSGTLRGFSHPWGSGLPARLEGSQGLPSQARRPRVSPLRPAPAAGEAVRGGGCFRFCRHLLPSVLAEKSSGLPAGHRKLPGGEPALGTGRNDGPGQVCDAGSGSSRWGAPAPSPPACGLHAGCRFCPEHEGRTFLEDASRLPAFPLGCQPTRDGGTGWRHVCCPFPGPRAQSVLRGHSPVRCPAGPGSCPR